MLSACLPSGLYDVERDLLACAKGLEALLTFRPCGRCALVRTTMICEGPVDVRSPTHGEDPMPPSSGAAQIFPHANYQGSSATLNPGSYNVNDLRSGSVGDDAISSLKVADGYTVTVYADPDFSGASATYTTDTPYVGDTLNDKISSLQVSKVGAPVPTNVSSISYLNDLYRLGTESDIMSEAARGYGDGSSIPPRP